MSCARRQARFAAATAPPGTRAGLAGLDFTAHMRRLCEQLVARLDALGHIDVGRVAISFSQTRKSTGYGMYAALTPMRFAGGRIHTIRRGRRWGVQRLYAPDGREYLYILNFYLPRFLDLDFREKLATIVHELWHINPRFDGDLRRFDGRCFAHGSSQKQYDATVAELVDRWLAQRPAAELSDFLRTNFRDLVSRHGRVFGCRIPAPKLVPLP